MLLAGDWNCRVGNRPDCVVCDRNVDNIDYNDYVPDSPSCRASVDNVCNTRGIKMLDFCKATGMRIANGLTGVDSECGSYTYYSRHTNSTIDYLLVNDIDRAIIDFFQCWSI